MLSKQKTMLKNFKLRPTCLPQRGMGIGAIILIVSLLVSIGIAASKFSGDTPGGDKQRVKLDSSSLIQQSAQLRNGLALLSSSTDIVWTGVGNANGKLSVASASASYTDSSTFPVGPIGTNSAPVSWNLGAYANAANIRPTVYGWTSSNVSAAVCAAINSGLLGGDGTPAVVALTGLTSASAQTLSGSLTQAYTVSAALAGIFETALGAQTTVCLNSDGGAYRVLVRLNN